MTEAAERPAEGSDHGVLGVGREDEQDAAVLDRPKPDDVDEERFVQLQRKKDDEGLTDDEANELGWMVAAKAGRPYSNAQARQHPDAEPEPEAAPTEGQTERSPRRVPGDPMEGEGADETAKDVAR